MVNDFFAGSEIILRFGLLVPGGRPNGFQEPRLDGGKSRTIGEETIRFESEF
jgi:hypothetical protein